MQQVTQVMYDSHVRFCLLSQSVDATQKFPAADKMMLQDRAMLKHLSFKLPQKLVFILFNELMDTFHCDVRAHLRACSSPVLPAGETDAAGFY